MPAFRSVYISLEFSSNTTVLPNGILRSLENRRLTMEKETRCFAIRCWVEHRLEVLKYAFEAHEEDMSRNKEWFKHAYGWLVEEFSYEEVVFLANILDNIERNQICAKLGGERLPRDFRPRSIKPIGSGRPRKQTNLYPIV